MQRNIPPKPKAFTPTESTLCKQFVNGIFQRRAYSFYDGDFELIHIPNERIGSGNKFNDIMYHKHLKSMGMLPGAPDYVILYSLPMEAFCRVAAIEFKRDKSCKLSENQKIFKSRCSDLAIPYLCTWSLDEAYDFVKRLFSAP